MLKAVPRKREGFLWISSAVFNQFAPKIQPVSFMTYAALCSMADNETQSCFPSKDKLGKMIGACEKTVFTALRELEQHGLIAINKLNGRRNEYTMLHVDSEGDQVKVTRTQEDPGNRLPGTQVTGYPLTRLTELDSKSNTLVLFEKPEQDAPADDPIPKAFAYFIQKAKKSNRYTLTPKRHKMAAKRWEEEVKHQREIGTQPDKIRAAVSAQFRKVLDELCASDYHQKNGYVEWEQVFESTERFEKWLDRYESNYSENNRTKHAVI